METIKARINHGRLIADCPNCSGAEFAALGMLFYCSSEFGGPDGWKNAKAAGKVFDVEFPDELPDILNILLVRPIENRNWEPGETVEFLVAENIEHGLPARAGVEE